MRQKSKSKLPPMASFLLKILLTRGGDSGWTDGAQRLLLGAWLLVGWGPARALAGTGGGTCCSGPDRRGSGSKSH